MSSKPRVGGSNPSGRANKIKDLLRMSGRPSRIGVPSRRRQLVLFDESSEFFG